MTMNEPAFVPPYLTLKEAAEYLERATGKEWSASNLLGFCATKQITLHAAPPPEAQAVQCEVTSYAPVLTVRPRRFAVGCMVGAHYWPATWRMGVVHPLTVGHVWQCGRGSVAHAVPTDRDDEPDLVLFVNDKHEPVTHEVTAADLRVSRDTLEGILSAWKRQRAAIAAELAAIPADTLAAVRATADALALHHAEQARRSVEVLRAGWGRQSPPEPAQAAAAPAHAPSASASPAARPEAVAVPAGAVPMAEAEGAEKRQDRRLAELRSMGADFVPHGKGWRVDGRRGVLADLIRREAGKPMGTKDGVRKDLSAAVQREMKRNGRVSR